MKKENLKHQPKKKDFNASKWEEDTKAIWDRPLTTLSCHMDLPRLGHKMKIYQNDELVSEPEDVDGSHSKMEIVRDILSTTAEACGESPELIETIKDKYFDYVKEDGSGDISQQLKSFLEAVIPEGSKLGSVLCLCHQKIVFPAYYSIKQNIFDELPFKDSRGSWLINVYFKDSHCTVVHRKVQMAKDNVAGEEECEFTFAWELVIELTGELFDNVSQVFVRIPEVTTRDSVSPERASEIQSVFDKYYPKKD